MNTSTRVQSVRGFNRFYTKQIGVLQQGWLGSPFSLPEARVLYELAHHELPTASDVGRELGLDAGYLSRLLRSLEHRGFVRRTRSKADGRSAHLSLTKVGRTAFEQLNQQTHEDVTAMLGQLSAGEQRQVVEAMHVIEGLLGPRQKRATSYVVRSPRAGDLGWVVHRQGSALRRGMGIQRGV